MNYANFWQRFCAAWIDIFVLLPFIVLDTWLGSLSKLIALVLVIPMSALFAAYSIYCHGRFGQTVGKRVMGIRVVRVDGQPIEWRQAWLRSSVDLVFTILNSISSLIALLTISGADYYGVGLMQRGQNLTNLEPYWLRWTYAGMQIWFWSEVVVMLFNRRRRALHDFIAGTVVVALSKIAEAK